MDSGSEDLSAVTTHKALDFDVTVPNTPTPLFPKGQTSGLPTQKPEGMPGIVMR